MFRLPLAEMGMVIPEAEDVFVLHSPSHTPREPDLSVQNEVLSLKSGTLSVQYEPENGPVLHPAAIRNILPIFPRLTPWEMGRVALGMRCGAAGSMSGEWRRSRVGDSGAGNRKVRPHAWPTYPTAPLLDTTRFPPFLPLWTGATASH